MTALQRRIVALHHPGTLLADVLWVGPPASESEQRRRVLARMGPGVRVSRFAGGYLVRLPAPVRIPPLSPVVALLPDGNGGLTAAPLHPLDRKALPAGTLAKVHHQGLATAHPEDLEPVDPSTWLSLGALPVAEVAPLGPPPVPPPVVVRVEPGPERFGVRPDPQALAIEGALRAPRKALPAAPPEGQGLSGRLASLWRWWRKTPAEGPAPAAAPRSTSARKAAPEPVPEEPSAWAKALGGLFAGLMNRMGVGPRDDDTAKKRRAEPPAPGLLDEMDRWAQRLGLSSALEEAVGRHNARYLQDMLDRFDQGDWLEGISRAIPLGKDGPSGFGGLTWLSGTRQIDFSAGPAHGGLSGGPDFYALLQRRYREAFGALAAQGRHKEAAYVLARLLGQLDEAVDHLQEHDQFALAAELVEAQEGDLGLAILLWFRAGEPARAERLARVHRAWAMAVQQADKRRLPDLARDLRRHWVLSEIAAGRYAAAITVASADATLEPLIVACLDPAVALGGAPGAMALLRSVHLRPERAAWHAEILDQWSDPVDLEAWVVLLGRVPTDPTLRRAIARALRRFLATSMPPRLEGAVRSLIPQIDPALAADLPALKPTLPRRTLAERRDDPLRRALLGGDTGTLPTFDGVGLLHGERLVAHGTLGLSWLDAQGRLKKRLAAAAHRLVPSADRTRVLLLWRRAEGWRVQRFFPLSDEVRPWLDLPLEAFADQFDGSAWMVAMDRRLLALDALADGQAVLWSAGNLGPNKTPAPIEHIELTDTSVVASTRLARGIERFRFEWPTLTLRERDLQEIGAARVLSLTQGVVAHRADQVVQYGQGGQGAGIATEGPAAACQLGSGITAILDQPGWAEGSRLRVYVHDGVVAELTFGGARQPWLRRVPGPGGVDHLFAGDELGRGVDLAPDTGELTVWRT